MVAGTGPIGSAPNVGARRAMSSTSRAVGRAAGSLASILSSSAARAGSIQARSGSRVTMLTSTATEAPSPNGGRPVPA